MTQQSNRLPQGGHYRGFILVLVLMYLIYEWKRNFISVLVIRIFFLSEGYTRKIHFDKLKSIFLILPFLLYSLCLNVDCFTMSHGLIMPHKIMGEMDLFKWTSINVSEERGSVEVPFTMEPKTRKLRYLSQSPSSALLSWNLHKYFNGHELILLLTPPLSGIATFPCPPSHFLSRMVNGAMALGLSHSGEMLRYT